MPRNHCEDAFNHEATARKKQLLGARARLPLPSNDSQRNETIGTSPINNWFLHSTTDARTVGRRPPTTVTTSQSTTKAACLTNSLSRTGPHLIRPSRRAHAPALSCDSLPPVSYSAHAGAGGCSRHSSSPAHASQKLITCQARRFLAGVSCVSVNGGRPTNW